MEDPCQDLRHTIMTFIKSLQINSVGYFLGKLLISSIPNPELVLNLWTATLFVYGTGGSTSLGVSLVSP